MDFKDLTNKELEEIVLKQLSEAKLNTREERREFFKFLSSFNSNNYSIRNKFILMHQANIYGLMPVFGSFKEWQKRGTSIQKGAKALTICVPNIKKLYFKKTKDNGIESSELIPQPLFDDEIKALNEQIKNNEVTVVNKLSFRYVNTVFSLTQTNMTEAERPDFLKRFNAENPSRENKRILDRLKRITDGLGIRYSEKEINDESLGFIDYTNNQITVSNKMPLDARINVLVHELGHLMLHDPKLEIEITHQDKEIQAQLFAHLTCAALNIDAESQSSMKYISNYLDTYGGSSIEISTLQKDVLLAHLEIVRPASDIIKEMIDNPRYFDKDLENIKNFYPKGFKYDELAKKASVVNLNQQKMVGMEMQ